MNRFLHLIMLLFLLAFATTRLKAQYQTTTQTLVRQEFFNPAYNSFKDYGSVSALSRWQWVDVANSPRTYALNGYVPLKNSAFGLGSTIIKEELGLRENITFYFDASHNVRLSRKSFLALGLGVGFESTQFDRDRFRAYFGTDFSLVDFSKVNPAITMGVMLLTPNYFIGLSTNTVFRSSKSTNTLPGFDFTSGVFVKINPSLSIKPCLVLKYYREGSVPADGEFTSGKYGKLISDLSLNFHLYNQIWIGTSHRFSQAQTFSFDFKILKNIAFGYTYEWGIGSGLNQYSSHGIRLAIDIKSNKKRRLKYWNSYLRNKKPILYI